MLAIPRSLATVAIALAAVPSFLAAQARPAERFTLGAGRAAIYNIVGTLRIEPGTGSAVEVEVTRQGADGARLKIETGDVRGRQALRVIYPSDQILYAPYGRRSRTETTINEDGTMGGERTGGRRRIRVTGTEGMDAHADIVVRMPKGADLAAWHLVGEVTVRNVEGTLMVDVGSADVTTTGTRGRLSLDTGSGEVKVSDAEGTIDLDVGSGDVTLDNVRGEQLFVDGGSGDVTGATIRTRSVRLDLGSGSTRLTGVRADELWVDSGSGDVDVALTDPIKDVNLDTGSGDVTLRVPAAFGARLEVDTGSGGIDSEIPITITRRSRSTLTGTIGDGGARVRIDTGSGGVRLVKN